MPLPVPIAGEEDKKFIDRCMINPTMINEFPNESQRFAVCRQQSRKREERSLIHNSKTTDDEPKWSSIDKTKLPLNAFVFEAAGTDKEKVTTWKFPHHFVKNGKDPDDKGRFTTGDLFLHRGGLNAAWSNAQGGRFGKKASAEIIAHLQRHRKAIGLVNNENRSFTFELLERQFSVKGNGDVEGIVSSFNNIVKGPFGDEIILRGAFKKTISEKINNGRGIPLLAKHASSASASEVIGTIIKAQERKEGLWIKAVFASTTRAQEIRQLMSEGHLKEFSVGMNVIKARPIIFQDQKVMRLVELSLREVTVVPIGADDHTKVLAVRSASADAPLYDGRITDEIIGKLGELIDRLQRESKPLAERKKHLDKLRKSLDRNRKIIKGESQ